MTPGQFWDNNYRPGSGDQHFYDTVDSLRPHFKHFEIEVDCSIDEFIRRVRGYKDMLAATIPDFQDADVVFARIRDEWGTTGIKIIVFASSTDILTALKLMIET